MRTTRPDAHRPQQVRHRLRPALVVLSLLPTLVVSGPSPALAAGDPAVTTVVGDPAKEGPALQVAINPYALALHDGRVLVADPSNGVVRSLDVDSGVFTTVAGLGGGFYYSHQFPDDGQPARSVQIGSPASLAVGADGSIYFGDTGFGGSVVRQVAPDGTVAIIAGNGLQAFSGDSGPARQAALYGQSGLAVAPDGLLWISDTYNNRVRRIDAGGRITTVVGSGEKGFAGDGGPATAAALDQPKGLAFTADGSLLIADSGNNRIRRVTPDGVISTVAGSGPSGGTTFGDGRGTMGDGGPATAALLHEPSAARPTGDGGFLIADTLNHKIRRVAPDGTISTVAGGGERHYGTDGIPAVDSNLFAPEDVLPLPDGRIVVADTRAARIRIIDRDGIIAGVAGTYFPTYSGDGGPGVLAQIAGPHRLAVADDGDIYFLDHRVDTVLRRLEADDGTIHPVAGYSSTREAPADGAAALTSYLGHAFAVEVADDGALLIAEPTLVRRIDPLTLQQQLWAGGVEPGDSGDGGSRLGARFNRIVALRALPDGSVLVVDQGTHRVRRIDANGVVSTVAGTGAAGFAGDGGPAPQAQLSWPGDAAMDKDGTLFIADESNGRLRAVGPDGTIRTVAGRGLLGFVDKKVPGPARDAEVRPSTLAVLPDGRVLMTDSFASSVLVYDPRDGYVRRYAGTGTNGYRDGSPSSAMFSLPQGLAVDLTRNRIYIGDPGNGRIRAVPVTDAAVQEPTPVDSSPAPTGPATVERLAGDDRFGTAVAVSRATFADTVDDVVLVTGNDWPDALAAGPAAASLDAPVLPVRRHAVPDVVGAELYRLQPRRAWVVGGPGVVDESVLETLRRAGVSVTRVSGLDRYATAAAVAERFFPQALGAYYASGSTYADALAGGAAAAHRGWPLLLTARGTVPPATPMVGSQRIVLGGTSVISEDVRLTLQARRVAGADRYATAAAIALEAFGRAGTGYLATGLDFPDALAGAAAAARADAPLLLAARDCVTPATRDAFTQLGVTRRVVLGGPAVVTARAAALGVC